MNAKYGHLKFYKYILVTCVLPYLPDFDELATLLICTWNQSMWIIVLEDSENVFKYFMLNTSVTTQVSITNQQH
jgi:hypothetical protein